MFRYVEWNNLLDIFENNASHCQYYKSSFPAGQLTINHPIDIIIEAFRVEVNKNWKKFEYGDKPESIVVIDKDDKVIELQYILDNYEIVFK